MSSRVDNRYRKALKTTPHKEQTMTYELIQAALTNLITFIAIAGFGGIITHAFWKHHINWMKTYCPPVG